MWHQRRILPHNIGSLFSVLCLGKNDVLNLTKTSLACPKKVNHLRMVE